jgi:prepilin-type N-terminal cleavage/methylation domain-containing protein/prepilin-type processing-associated H-X9-DG protein
MAADLRMRRLSCGFTLIELLVAIVILSILAGLLLPTLVHAKSRGQATFCVSNFRQLQIAWQLYAEDSDGRLPYNWADLGSGTLTANWVGGWIQGSDNWHDNTNTTKLLKAMGGIGTYLNEAKVFKCPADRTLARINGKLYPRVRSVGMNGYVGGQPGSLPFGSRTEDTDFLYLTIDKITRRPPSETGFVFIDAHEDSIASGYFQVSFPYSPGWSCFPGTRHGRAASVSFADGHVVSHKWRDARTFVPILGYSQTGINYGIRQPGNVDIRWIEDRALLVDPRFQEFWQ